MARPKNTEKPKKSAKAAPKPKRAAGASAADRGRGGDGPRSSRGGGDGEDDGPSSIPAPDSIAPVSIRSASRGEEPADDGDERERDGDDEPDHDVIDASSEVVEGDDDADVGAGESIPASASEGAALSRTDPLQAYLREVQRHKLLTPEEEKELTTKYATTQDIQTAARLVTANLRLVVKLAYEYRRAYKNIMDLIQEGNIGLMQAVKRFDPYRGVKLSSYAAWWIRAYILRFILNNWRLVKLGTTQAQRKLFFNLNKEKAKLAAMGIDATPLLIAENLGVEEQEVIEMDRRLSSAEASLDAPVGDAEGRSVSRIDLMPSANSGPDVQLERSELGSMVHERLQQFRTTLKGKDVVIFDKRMVAEEPLTLQELGTEFGVSRERVRQLEARLTSKLRDYLSKELGDAVADQGGA
ncbi:MAG: RNA polymerase factor sigma-32 [Polyangiaceae bacterium]